MHASKASSSLSLEADLLNLKYKMRCFKILFLHILHCNLQFNSEMFRNSTNASGWVSGSFFLTYPAFAVNTKRRVERTIFRLISSRKSLHSLAPVAVTSEFSLRMKALLYVSKSKALERGKQAKRGMEAQKPDDFTKCSCHILQ